MTEIGHEIDLNQLARNLATATTNLDRFIAAEVKRRSDRLGVEHAKAADERVRAHMAAHAAEMQRLKDLVKEFERQREPLGHAADMAHRIAGIVRGAKYAGEQTIDVKVLLGILDAPRASGGDGDAHAPV